jgi:hypothetical protein
MDERKLASCTDYKIIRMDIRYDSRFCRANGESDPAKANTYVNSIVQVMNAFYNAAPLCFRVEVCNIQGFCSSGGDRHLALVENSNTVCDGNTNLLDDFRNMYQPRPPQGCDSTHLFYGGDGFSDTIGCANLGSLCDEFSYGVNQISFSDLLFMQAILVAHELGLNLNADHVSGNGQYVMEPSMDDAGGFKAQSISVMTTFVDAIQSQDPTCTTTTAAGSPTPDPSPDPTPDPSPIVIRS